jgi:hypothetical protein
MREVVTCKDVVNTLGIGHLRLRVPWSKHMLELCWVSSSGGPPTLDSRIDRPHQKLSDL